MGDSVSVLDLRWNTNEDTLNCDLNGLREVGKISLTKRGLLSAAQRIFDPVGFTCPVTLIIPRLLLQKCWKISCSWDDQPSKEISSFKKLLSQVDLLNLCYIFTAISKTKCFSNITASLHVFCDTSQLAYAACVFLRIEGDEIVKVSLILAKS